MFRFELRLIPTTLVDENTNGRWESYHQLVLALDGFYNALMGNMQRFIEVGDSSGVETIWACCVICLAHLAALSHLTGQTELTLRGSMNNLCDLTLNRLGTVSREIHVEVYSHFDVLTGVRIRVGFLKVRKALTKCFNQISWKRALDTIDLRIGLCPHSESRSLRYLRGVIGKVHADFQANLLGCGPASFMPLVMLMDGRTANSKYPNLLLPTERERFGL